jgi:hypothetical protein
MENHTFDPKGDIALIMRKRSYTSPEIETEGGPYQEVNDGNFCMLVSSKHLFLASSFFEEMLQAHFKEGQTLRSDGFLELPLPDDDPIAFCILLDIIHGHTRKVPRTVDMNMLADIAILVDKYQLQEVVEVFSDGWIKSLEPQVPTKSSEDLIVWLCISWVFGCADQFKKMTQILERESDSTVNAEGLPIPPGILGMC